MAKKTTKKTKARAGGVPAKPSEDTGGSWAAKHRPADLNSMSISNAGKALAERFLSARPRTGTVLIHGPSGSGKTTLAFIMAQALSNGEEADITDYNAATQTGVEGIRNLLAASRYSPSTKTGRRVFIIDEAHALTAQSKSALLKDFESPPDEGSPPVIWIMCTDKLSAVPAQLQSRAIKIAMKSPTGDSARGRLKAILGEEAPQYIKKWPERDLRALFDHCLTSAGGNFRTAIHILQETCLSIGLSPGMSLSKATAKGLLAGAPDQEELGVARAVLLHLLSGDPEELETAIKELNNVNPASAVEAMLASATVAAVSGPANERMRFLAACGVLATALKDITASPGLPLAAKGFLFAAAGKISYNASVPA